MEVSDEIEGVLNDASDDKVVLETIAVLPLSLKKRHGDESSKSELEDLAKRQTTLESQTKSKNESWDVMFERMCKYKQTYGVRASWFLSVILHHVV